MRVLIWVAVAACSSPRSRPEPPANHAVMTPPPPSSSELRATLRIDAATGERPGVSLELGDGTRYVVDHRARLLWRGFDGAQVIATGHCDAPSGEAIGVPHFRIERLRLAPTVAMTTPLLEVGREAVLHGTFVEVAFPIGSKRAGSRELRFDETGGGSYVVHGADEDVPPPSPGPATIRARAIVINPAYAATTGGPRLWIVELDAADRAEPRAIPCPDGPRQR